MKQLRDRIDMNTSKKSDIPFHSNKRPSLSYVGLIALAIQSHPEKKMRLSDIYQWIADNYPYFKSRNGASWRNSVRHNLSLNECFVKVGHGEHGKGHYWRIHSANEADFARGDFRRRNARMKVIKGDSANLASDYMNSSVVLPVECDLFQLKGRQISDTLHYKNWLLCGNRLELYGYEAMTLLRASLETLVNMFGLEAVTSTNERKWILKSRQGTSWHHTQALHLDINRKI